MNEEFHYYIVRYLAGEAGLENEADTIAYASQFVDACLVPYSIETGSEVYEIRPTQNYAFWNDETARDIYLPFHFVPGGKAGNATSNRVDGERNPYNTVAGSGIAKEFLVSALKTRNPYRVGIALHAYADTWAHQNFSGFSEEWNALDERLPLPPAGHLQALKSPDSLVETWTDPRLAGEQSRVSNRERFLAAARMIYKFLCTYNRRGFGDVEPVMERLEGFWGSPGRERERKERQFEYVISAGMDEFDRTEWLHEAGIYENGDGSPEFPDYNKVVWLKQELKNFAKIRNRKPIALGKAFYDTRLYRFCEAAEAHKAEAKRIRLAAGLDD
jgi:hypothetical protein